MPKLKGKTQITFHLDDEAFEDLNIVRLRYGCNMSEFIRRAIHAELRREAERQVS